ncbi:DUF7373 family lipoprotein [Mycobacterium branderi]|nr:hypothetical protein [Mycobacterium branderi]MCV7235260.1 hypothetical protein [Mycobacterium branderi]
MTARALSALAMVCAAVAAGCTEIATGTAVKAPGGAGDASVAQMDTGSYPTTAGPPIGSAADDPQAAAAEARRMAGYVVGPWQVEASLRDLDFYATAPIPDTAKVMMTLSLPFTPISWGNAFGDIAKAHSFIAGFESGRAGTGEVQKLYNVVMRFADADAAAAAAREMVAVNPPPALLKMTWNFPRPTTSTEPFDSWQTGACTGYDSEPVKPDFAASASAGGRIAIRSFTNHGLYVLYQFVIAMTTNPGCDAIIDVLKEQARLIDRFPPTDREEMADLPLDPTGRLWARTIPAPDGGEPFSAGVWQPNSWLHFEDNPVEAATLFQDAGVDWVVQRSTRVYQARNSAGSARLVDRFLADTRALPDVKPTQTGVPGFPGATCFERTKPIPLPVARTAMTLRQALWHFKCIAQTDRYAFISFSGDEKDAKQQISAQYRVLAGK